MLLWICEKMIESVIKPSLQIYPIGWNVMIERKDHKNEYVYCSAW